MSNRTTMSTENMSENFEIEQTNEKSKNLLTSSDSSDCSSTSSKTMVSFLGVKPTFESIDVPAQILRITGSWGRWQAQFFAYFLITAICSSWHSLQWTFIAPNIDFECDISSRPTIDGNNETIANKCDAACDQWSFDVGKNGSFYRRTIISEWSLVCDRRWLISPAQSVYMIGTLISVFGMSHSSDSFGRRKTIVIGLIAQFGGTIFAANCGSITQFLVARFIIAFGMGTTWSTGFVLLLEIVGPRYRELIGLAVQLGWAAGYISLPLIAYLLPDFRHILLCCAALPAIQALTAYFVLPESPRWLLTTGRYDRAARVLRYAAKINSNNNNNNNNYSNKKIDIEAEIEKLNPQKSKSVESNSSSSSSASFSLATTTANSVTAATTTTAADATATPTVEQQVKKYTILDLFRRGHRMIRMTVMIYVIWFANSLVYYGLSLNAGSLNGDVFVNFFLLGVVEIPAYLACMFAVPKFGHRSSLFVTLFVAGIGSFGAIAINANYYVGIIATMAGKFCVTSSFAIIYVYTAQLYPTVIRTIGLGSSSTVARFGSILAPFIKDLSEAAGLAVAMTILGVLSIIGALLILALPESTGTEMPDRPEDLERKLKKSTTQKQV